MSNLETEVIDLRLMISSVESMATRADKYTKDLQGQILFHSRELHKSDRNILKMVIELSHKCQDLQERLEKMEGEKSP